MTGASSGIGEAFARRLARDGFDLLLVARRRPRLERLARELAEAHGATVDVLAADLTRAAPLRALEARLEGEARLELLVNSAGRGEFGRLAESPREALDAELRLNALALLRVAHAALRPMLARRRGAVVNVSSTAAFVPCPHYAVYGASKAFVNSLSEALHEELRGTGVRVQALCPGLTHTEIFESAGVDVSSLPGFLWMTPEAVVDASLAALERDEVICVPGLGNRTFASLVRLLPHAATGRVASALTRRAVRPR
ncbi:MAG TPA: SDR family oxidoreductase [Solirubrobacteraceae bacterium]|nr:SDR family oxidoreductase [Solirubrobacteraceae bacterium]